MISIDVSQNSIHPLPAAYAKAAVLANALNAEMLSRLEWVTLQPKRILDIGCGTGQSVQLLQQRYPTAEIIALDIAYPMLQFARQQALTPTYVCADANLLPLPDASADLI